MAGRQQFLRIAGDILHAELSWFGERLKAAFDAPGRIVGEVVEPAEVDACRSFLIAHAQANAFAALDHNEIERADLEPGRFSGGV
jgi:hypothetical protein